MSLSGAKADMKTALLAMANNVNDEQSASDAVDDFLSALETWVGASKLTIPIGGVIVTGTAATQNNPAPIVVDNSLS